MKQILVLGTGCPKCKKMAELSEQAAQEMGIDYELRKIEDINQIMSFGIIMTPALVVDGEIKVTGKVPSSEEIKKLLS
jgi:small redox-active disulfide protein 2